MRIDKSNEFIKVPSPLKEEYKGVKEKMVFFVGSLILINSVLLVFLFDVQRIYWASFIQYFMRNIVITLLGFILGLVVAIIPFKSLGYRSKYLIASLVSMLFMQVLFFICIIYELVKLTFE